MQQQTRYDLFVSFADTAADRAWVEGFLLPELGLPRERVVTQHDLRPGASQADEFARAVEQSRFTLLVLSASFLTDRWLAFGEQLATWTSVEEGQARLIPLLLEDVDLPPRLKYLVKLDCTTKEQWQDEVGRLRGLLDQPSPGPERAIECPYPGMVAFERKDAGRYFGREKLVLGTVDRLAAQSFIALIGASGSGKSSFINAGILPALERDPRFGQRPPHVVRFRPGPSPIAQLGAEIARDSPQDAATLIARLDSDSASLGPALEVITSGDDSGAFGLLIVDQFEEAFAQCKDVPLRLRFFELLDRLLRDVPSQWRVIIAIRADFYPEAMGSSLWPRMRAALIELLPLSDEDLERAIEEPARQVGVYLEPALVNRLIGDAEDEKGPLPLLQQTLVVMWSRFMRRRLLTLADYEMLGTDGRTGLQEALRGWADATLSELSEPGREDIARRIFIRLIEFGAARKDTRRQQPRDELLAGGAAEPEAEAVLEILIKRRLVTTDVDEVTGRASVDLAHETLIEAWPRLHDWVVTYEDMESRRRQLAMSASAWQANSRDDSYAFTGRRLREVEAWVTDWPQEVGTREREFLDASQRVDRSVRRRRRVTAGLAAGLVVIGLGAAVYLGSRELARMRVMEDSPLEPIAGGVAVIGSDNPARQDHETNVPAFEIDVYEVSNAQYRACDESGPCDPPVDRVPYDAPDAGDLPVVAVTPFHAETYCGWLGRRLPTSTEWERAARGADGRAWPWGNEFPTGFEMPSGPVPVESGQELTSPEGIQFLVGNVAEWVVRDAPDVYAAVGGAYDRPIELVTEMSDSSGANWDPSTGFRCAADGG